MSKNEKETNPIMITEAEKFTYGLLVRAYSLRSENPRQSLEYLMYSRSICEDLKHREVRVNLIIEQIDSDISEVKLLLKSLNSDYNRYIKVLNLANELDNYPLFREYFKKISDTAGASGKKLPPEAIESFNIWTLEVRLKELETYGQN